MTTILSTKKLTAAQQQHLLNAGLAFVDYDFIATKEIPFQLPEKTIENAIFTSQNGVKAVFSKEITIKNSFCVGKRTEKLILKEKTKIIHCENNAEALSEWIITNNSKVTYYYFCAKDRLATLPDKLTKNNINWHEIPVYKTVLTPKKYAQQFNSVLFFSPSGVESYFSVNTAPQHSFCIGNTTATALQNYTKNYTVASQPSVENVIIKAIKHYTTND